MNDLSNLPLELQYQIYSKVPPADILKLCQTDRYFSTLCSDADFWRYRAYQDFSVTSDIFDKTDLSPHLRYLQLLSTTGQACVPGSERFVDTNTCLYRTARNGNLEALNYFLNGPGEIRIYDALRGAAESGNLELVRHLIGLLNEKKYFVLGWDLSIILSIAAGSGNVRLVEYLAPVLRISSRNEYMEDLNYALYNAAKADDMKMISVLRSLGASDIEQILYGAVAGDNLELFNFAINEGAGNFDRALIEAISNRNRKFIDMIIGLGIRDFNRALESAVKSDLPTLQYIVDKMERQGLRVERENLDRLIFISMFDKIDLDIIDYLIGFRPTSLERSIREAAGIDNVLLIHFIDEANRLRILDRMTLDKAFAWALVKNKTDNVEYLWNIGARLYPYLATIIVDGHYNEDVKMLVSAGYPNYITIIEIRDLIQIARDVDNLDIIGYLENYTR